MFLKGHKTRTDSGIVKWYLATLKISCIERLMEDRVRFLVSFLHCFHFTSNLPTNRTYVIVGIFLLLEKNSRLCNLLILRSPWLLKNYAFYLSKSSCFISLYIWWDPDTSKRLSQGVENFTECLYIYIYIHIRNYSKFSAP